MGRRSTARRRGARERVNLVHEAGERAQAAATGTNAAGAPFVLLRGDGTSGGPVLLSTSVAGAAGYTPTAAQQSLATWPQQQAGAKPIPTMPAISDTRPYLKSLGATGTAIFSGIISSEEYNPDFYWKDAIVIYEQMRRNDAQINAVQLLVEQPIRRATWAIEPGSDQPVDAEIASFVESSLFHDMKYQTTEGRTLRQGWDYTLRQILLHLWFGFMAFEVNWRIEDTWVQWARWTPLLPRTVWRWWVGRDNELAGIQQWTYKDYSYQFVDIPADKLLLFVNRQEGNNYEGVSLLRTAYKHWWFKEQFYKIQSIDIERNAISMPWIQLPENFSAADLTNAQSMLTNMRGNEAMGLTTPPGWKVEYLRNYERNEAQVQPAIEHHDQMIARNVLGMVLNVGSTGTGSYAMDISKKGLLLAALQAICEYIEDTINNDAIPRLVDYNYADVAVYPRLKSSKLIAQDLDVIADALAKLANSMNGPLIHPDPDLEDYLRDQYGLPKAAAGIVQGTNPTAGPGGGAPNDDGQDEGDQGDQESQDVTPGAAQQARSTAMANAPAQMNEWSSTDDAADDGPSEAALLRAALTEAGVLDVVERGMAFYSPDQLRIRGRFGFEHGPQHGTGRRGSGENEKGAGGKGTRGGGRKAKSEDERQARAQRKAKGAEDAARAAGHREAESMHQAAVKARGGKGAGAKGGGKPKATPEERAAGAQQRKVEAARAKVETARERLDRAEAARRQDEAVLATGDHGLQEGARHAILDRASGNLKEMEAAHKALAKLEGRDLHPAEGLYTRAEFESGKASWTDRAGHDHEVSREEAAAWRANPRLADHPELGGKVGRATGKASATRAPKEPAPRGERTPRVTSATQSLHDEAATWRAAHLEAPRETGPEKAGDLSVTPRAAAGEFVGRAFTPGATPQLDLLTGLYGEHQLGAALSRYSVPVLREVADAHGIAHTGTRAALLSRLTAAGTHGHYSADFAHVGRARALETTDSGTPHASGDAEP